MAQKKENRKKPLKHATSTFKPFDKIKKAYSNHTVKLGAHIYHIGKYVFTNTFNKVKACFGFVNKKISSVFSKIGSKIGGFFAKRKAVIDARIERHRTFKANIKTTRVEKGAFKAATYATGGFFKFVWSCRGALKTLINYAAPVVALMFFVNLITVGTNTQYAIGIEYEGKVLGYVEAEADFNEAQQLMQARITYVEGDTEIKIEPRLSVQQISDDQTIDSVDELTDKLLDNSEAAVIDAHGLYINGEFIGASKTISSVKALLDNTLMQYQTGTEGERVSFIDSIEIKDGLYVENGIVPESDLLALLTSQEEEDTYYTVVEGDAPLSIASKLGISYDELKKLNPDIDTNCYVGTQILINTAVPFLSVQITRSEEYDVVLDYASISVEDSTKYEGTTVLIQEGVEGSAHIISDVTYVNGYEVSRTVVSEEVTVEPIDRQISVGTKPSGYSQVAYDVSDGGFLWPVGGSGGTISSPYGPRSYDGWHSGIDIASIPYGTPIYAAADGYVTKAVNQNYGYGYHIMIDHGSGYSTVYGHCSKLYVTAGQYVKKGDVIGAIGSTGDSTGNHLHFEIREYGEYLNPANFVSLY